MNRSETSSSNGNNNQRRNALIVAGFLTIFMGTLAIYFGLQGPGIPPFLIGALVLMSTVSAFAGWLSYKGHVQSGMLLVIATFLPLIILNQLNSAGDSLLNGLMAVVVTAGIALPTLSGKWLNRSIVVGIFVGVLVVLIDVFGPTNRPDFQAGLMDYIIYTVLISAVVFLIVRQLRDATLRPKLIAGFAFIALIGSLFTFATTQFVTNSFTEDAIPNEQLVGQIAQTSRAVQAEALEFISLGNEDAVEQLHESIAEITALSVQVRNLADGPDEAADFETLVRNAGEATQLAQNLVQSHQETLTALETVETVEENLADVFVTAHAVIDEEIAGNFAAGDLDKLEEDTIPAQTLLLELRDKLNLLLFESVEFVAGGKTSSLDQIEITIEQLEVVQRELDLFLDADLRIQLNELDESVQNVSQSLITSHTNTLDLLQQLADKEHDVADSLQVVEGKLLQNVTVGEANANKAAVLSTLVALSISGVLALLMSNRMAKPISRLVTVAQRLGDGDLSAEAQIETSDEIGTLAVAFNDMAVQLRQTLGRLDRRVQQMEASAAVSQRLSTILDEQELVTAVVTSLQTAFNYYHVHIYLLNQTGDRLMMAGGTGDAGAEMLANNHALAVGRGLVGSTAQTNTAKLVSDVSQSDTWVANPLLPETRSEIAVPIALGDEVLGVLDVQSNVVNGLQALDQELLQAITNQIAIALQNARQYKEVQRSQEAIRERETLLRTIIDSTPDWIFVKDVDHRYLMVNQGYADVFHTTPDVFVGKNDLDMGFSEELVKGDPDKGIRGFWADDREIMDSGQMKVFDVDPATVDGEVHLFNTIKAPLKDADGNVIGVVGFARDITDRLRIEEALRRGEVDLSQALKIAKLAYWEYDVENDLFTFNDQFYALFHTTAEEHGGYQLSSAYYAQHFVYPDDLPMVGAEIERGLNSTEQHFNRQVEHRILYADGGVGYISVNINIERDEQGKILSYVGANQDITERKRIEEALQAEQERAQAILESINVPFAVTKMSDGKVIYCNKALADLVDVPHKELIGQVMPDFYADPADREVYITQLREQGFVENFDLHMKRGDGQQYWALLSGRSIQFQGVPAIITFALDVTERRVAQAAAARRAAEMETVADVGTVAATILEPDRLLQEAVNLIKSRFDLYHAHIYLIAEDEDQLVLTNGAGDIGQQMVNEGRQIALGQERSLVARAARNRQGVIINDAQAEPGFLPHPLLPNTHAEMAVPLVVGEQLLGVLDIQADMINRFTATDISIFTALANQVAVALQNARRYDESQRALDELTHLQRVMAREGWEAFLTAQERPFFGYSFNTKGAQQIVNKENRMIDGMAVNGYTPETEAETETAVSSAAATLSIPITVRGEQIGQIGLRNPDGSSIPERSRFMLQNITHQMSEALERARLFEETEVARQQTETLYKGSDLVVRATNPDEVLQALISSTILQKMERTSIALFDKPWAESPETFTIAAAWAENDERLQFPVGTIIPIKLFPIIGSLAEKEHLIVANVATDTQIGEENRAFAQQVQAVSYFLLPLRIGGQWIGFINSASNRPADVSGEKVRQLSSLVDQAATVLQSLQLYAASQERANQEQMLREVSARITTAVDADAILRTAAQEIGRAFGLETFVFLADPVLETEGTNGADAH